MKNINRKNNTQKQEIPGKVKKGFRFYAAAVLSLALVMGMSVTAFAAGDPISVVNNLSDFIFGLIRAVGLILLGWGIVQVGLSFQSHDPSQRSNGFLTLAGGVIITFAKEILNLIGFPKKGRSAMTAPDWRCNECRITGLYRISKMPLRYGTISCLRSGN